MGTPTRVSLNREVTNLLGYRWTCKSGFTIPKTGRAVKRALESGDLKAVVRPLLRLDKKRTPFAEQLHRDKVSGFANCVDLMGSRKKRRKISPPPRSANSIPLAPRIHTDSKSTDSDRSDDHGSGNHGPLLDTSGGSAVVGHAHLPRKRLQDEDADGTQIIGNDPFSEELSEANASHDPAPIPHGRSASRLTLPEFWDTRVKSVEVEAHNPKRKGSIVKCLTCTGTELKLKSFRSLLTGRGELESEIVDACLSTLAGRSEASQKGQKTVLFESAFWRTYQKGRRHLGLRYDMVARPEDGEMLLFPIYQDDHWTLHEVSRAKKAIRHYAPRDLDLTDIVKRVEICLKTEFALEIEEWTVDLKPLPQGNSGVLILATAAQRVLRKDVDYSKEDIAGLHRWIAAILLGMEVQEFC